MPTLLHISDLHRTPGPYLTNEELITALASDSKRWESEGIPQPDLVVISGDIIQGVSNPEDGSDEEISKQYREAKNFLIDLARQFTNSDRSRVFIVPGNHDVRWDTARSAMIPMASSPDDLDHLALEATSLLRWDWETQQTYEIVDHDKYDSRCDDYRAFVKDFYADIDYPPTFNEDLDLISCHYESLGLAIVGFASWYGNDCYCKVGDIDPAALRASQQLLEESSSSIPIAVWHHSIIGGPRQQDYMDQQVIHKLIDYGFAIGLHGHQHFAEAAPFELKLPNLTSMAVVGAGSLAVGDIHLPVGELRQFNIIDIDKDAYSIDIHVRAMSPGGIFFGTHRDDFGGKTYTSMNLSKSKSYRPKQTNTTALDQSIRLVKEENYGEALANLPDHVDDSQEYAIRQVKKIAYESLELHDLLMEVLNPPQNVDEAAKLISMLIDGGRYHEAEECLEASRSLMDISLHNDLFLRITTERYING